MLHILFLIESQATVVIKDNQERKVSYFQVAIFRVTENFSLKANAMSYCHITSLLSETFGILLS